MIYLPAEVWVNICLHLDIKTLASLKGIRVIWRQIDSDYFWAAKAEKDFRISAETFYGSALNAECKYNLAAGFQISKVLLASIKIDNPEPFQYLISIKRHKLAVYPLIKQLIEHKCYHISNVIMARSREIFDNETCLYETLRQKILSGDAFALHLYIIRYTIDYQDSATRRTIYHHLMCYLRGLINNRGNLDQYLPKFYLISEIILKNNPDLNLRDRSGNRVSNILWIIICKLDKSNVKSSLIKLYNDIVAMKANII